MHYGSFILGALAASVVWGGIVWFLFTNDKAKAKTEVAVDKAEKKIDAKVDEVVSEVKEKIAEVKEKL